MSDIDELTDAIAVARETTDQWFAGVIEMAGEAPSDMIAVTWDAVLAERVASDVALNRLVLRVLRGMEAAVTHDDPQ